MGRECVGLEWHDWHATITMALPQCRNAVSEQHMRELIEAFEEVADPDRRGVILAGDGPVFSAGHDFADMAGRDLGDMRRLLRACTELMLTMQAVAQVVLAEMAFTGDTIDAATAADWGLVNRVVPDDELDDACLELLERATRGSRSSKALGKQTLYHQLGLSQQDAYAHAVEVMAASSQTADGREAMASFLEKRQPEWTHR